MREDCLVIDLSEDGKWRDRDCTQTAPYFVCEHDPNAQTTTTTTTTKARLTGMYQIKV